MRQRNVDNSLGMHTENNKKKPFECYFPFYVIVSHRIIPIKKSTHPRKKIFIRELRLFDAFVMFILFYYTWIIHDELKWR